MHMRKVLMISPHFPPDTSAATHRVRLLAPHLTAYGWEPTVVTVDPRDYESRLDHDLSQLVPESVRVIRCRAWSARWTRRCGIGDLGLRALPGLYATCARLLRTERFAVLFITIYPTYPALLGPLLKRTFAVPFVLDYQDPWIGAWGETVGGGPRGTPDRKSRLTRWLAERCEPWTVKAVDAVTAVSQATADAVYARNPGIKDTPSEEIPMGGEPADFAFLRKHRRVNRYFAADDGCFHLCYVGTLLPLGFETLRAVLQAVATLRQRQPELYARLRLHFFGTSNQTTANATQRVMPVAREFGLEDCVTEIAPRIAYLDALTVLTQASAILMMGSSEAHYTASKLYPGLLAQRPILAVFHEKSSVVGMFTSKHRVQRVQVVTYSDTKRVATCRDAIYASLVTLLSGADDKTGGINSTMMEQFSAQALAGRLAAVFDRIARP
jgi:hypothetical protein